MSRIALAVLLTASVAWSQAGPIGGFGPGPIRRDPGLGGGGIDPGPGGDPGGEELGAVALPAGIDLFDHAAQVNRFDSLPPGFFGPGSDPFSGALGPGSTPTDLLLSPGLQEATDDLLRRQYGIDTELVQLDLSGGNAQGQPPPDPGPSRDLTRPELSGPPGPHAGRHGARHVGRVHRVGGNANAPAPGQDPPRQGGAQRVLIEVPEPPTGDRASRLVGPRTDDRLTISDLREIIDAAAADVLANRIARGVDPNSRENQGRSPEERRMLGELGLVLLDVIDGLDASPEALQLLRDHLAEVLALLDAATRDPGSQSGPLQQAIEEAVGAIVEWIRGGIAR